MSHPSALPATTPSDDATLIADHMLRFWTPVPESYGVMQAAKRILVAAGQEIPEGLINRYLRLSAPSEGSASDTPTDEVRDDDDVDDAFDDAYVTLRRRGCLRIAARLQAARAYLRVPPSAPDTKPDDHSKLRQRSANELDEIATRLWTALDGDQGPLALDLAVLLGAARDHECAACEMRRVSSSPPEGEDTQRLDWLEERTKAAPGQYSGLAIAILSDDSFAVGEAASVGFNGWADGEGPTLREAIDSARAAIPPQKTGHES